MAVFVNSLCLLHTYADTTSSTQQRASEVVLLPCTGMATPLAISSHSHTSGTTGAACWFRRYNLRHSIEGRWNRL